MIYRVIGITSGGRPASLDIAFAEFTATAGNWQFEVIAAEQIIYDNEWQAKLEEALRLTVPQFQLLHQEYGTFIGRQVNAFIEKYALHHKVQLIVCDGHNVLDVPGQKLLVQLGSGAQIATETGLVVITDLKAMDNALGGSSDKAFARAQSLLFPAKELVQEHAGDPFENAVLAAMMGILRWREEATTTIAATGASMPSIGGAVWLGNEA